MCLPFIAAAAPALATGSAVSGGAVAASTAGMGAAMSGIAAGTTALTTSGAVAGSAAAAAAAGGGATMFGMSAATLSNAMLTTSLLGGGLSAYGQYQQGKFAGDVAANNAKIESQIRSDTIRRGANEEAKLRAQIAGQKSDMRTTMAANGLSVESGTPLGMLQDTAEMGELDALTLRANYGREAWQHEMKASNYRANGDMARRSGRNSAFNTLLTSGSRVGRDWMMFKGGYTNVGQPGLV